MPKEMVTIEAVKRLRYRTRMIVPGEAFEATPADARILIGVKRARAVERTVGELPAPPKSVADKFKAFNADGKDGPGGSQKPAADPELPALRAQYTEKLGKRPFPGWDAEELRRRMAEAAAS